jgi:hypothetical protein
VLVVVLVCLACLWRLPSVLGDEGMWLFNNPPRDYLKKTYNFDATPEWLLHLQRSSVRFEDGGSGSFVSSDGLVLTNHHVASEALKKMMKANYNPYRDGFYAKTRTEEHKIDAMEINVLMDITDVTDRVMAAVKPGMSAEEAFKARRGVMADIEKEAFDKTGYRSDVVTLYQGALYHLYQFKKYTDVRLVFAPEKQIAFFGGDPDNFEYPRYDLDMALFRVYENNQPVKPKHYLKWSKSGAGDGELVFVSGHPGRTDRMATVAELDYLRDTGFPFLLQRLYRWEVLLHAYSQRSSKNAAEAENRFFSIQNSRKARDGGLAGLLDPDLIKRKKEYEKKLRETADKDDKLKEARGAWAKVAGAEKVRAEIIRKYTMLEGQAGFSTELFGIARTLVRAAEEISRPNADRLREFRDSNLDSLKLQLFSTEEIHDDLEMVRLADALTFLGEVLGHDTPLVQRVLAGKSPQERAAELIKGTKLKSVEERKRLFEGGKKAIEESKDPMIALARLVDPESRAVRKVQETQIEEVKRQAYAEIAKAKFALEGTNTYPDATFTLRLAFGVVKGYEEAGKHIPYQTTFAGLYERSADHHNKEPFDLPPRWLEKKDKLNLNTPLNFVCTADIIGGNSGSPVVNRKGELVGLIFDGNIQSLVLDFAYTEKQARAVSVCSPGMLEALRKVYDANDLVDELLGQQK